MNKKKEALILLEKYDYNKKTMPPRTRFLYDSYQISDEEELKWMEDYYDKLREDCSSFITPMPFLKLIWHVKDNNLYSRSEDLIKIVKENEKRRTPFGLLNLYDILFCYWFSPHVDKNKVKNISDFLIERYEELSYIVDSDDFNDFEEEHGEANYILKRCNIILENLKERN